MSALQFLQWIYIYFLINIKFCICVDKEIEIHLNHSPVPGNAVNLKEGTNAELKCLSSDTAAVMTWRRAGHSSFIIYDQKLVVDSVQRANAGEYTCTVALSSGKEAGQTVIVNVLYPPTMPTITGPYKALKRSTFDLTCHADANPAATYKWTYYEYPNSSVIQTGSKMTVEDLNTNDLWLYCHAQNTMVPTGENPETVTNTGYRHVIAQKGAYIWHLEDTYTFDIGSILDVRCKAEGIPPPIYWWTREGDENFEMSGERLIVKDVQANFAGVYMCYVENTLQPTDGPEKMVTDSQRTVIKIVDPTIPEVCQDLLCLHNEAIQSPSTCPVTSCNGQTGIIVAAVIGWIIAAIAVATVVIFCLRKKRTPNDEDKDEPTTKQPTAPTLSVIPNQPAASADSTPTLPKRPLGKQTSEHVYLELQPDDPRNDNLSYGHVTTPEYDSTRADHGRDGKPHYDYVHPTDEVIRTNNTRMPPDGYEETSAGSENPKDRYDPLIHDDNTTQDQPDRLSNAKGSNLTDVNNGQSTNQSVSKKRHDSYEEPIEKLQCIQ